MKHFSQSPRIAFIDLTFNWPPVGGCWIDTHHVIAGLQDRGAMVTLFTPDFQKYYPRGKILQSPPYPVVSIPFNRFTYNYHMVRKRFKACVDSFQPDLIFLTDGYHMKNHLLTAFGPERCFLRFYSYEMLCINLHYYRYHEDRICDMGYFNQPLECHRCWFRRMPMSGRAFQIAIDWPETHPKLHFSQEYIASLAFTETYRQKLLDNFKKLRGAIVYNSFMQEKLADFIDDIHIIPSGVDPVKFHPCEKSNQSDTVKIFLPGRANDPHKGLPIAIEALKSLAHEELKFELHYTAAMDCETKEPWLINRGWVDQSRLPAMYSEMDIVIVPSTWVEPFGITALEGMASGLPVVASKIGGLAHTVVDGVTGYHAEPANPASLAKALRKLIVDPELRMKLGQSGREQVLQKYDWNIIVDQHYVPMIEHALHLKPQQLTITEKLEGRMSSV